MAISPAPAVNTSEHDRHRSVGWYRDMVLLRRFEDRCYRIYKTMTGKINGFLHLYTGQEAVAVGCVAAARPQDHIITAYRDHGLGLARGMTCEECMAELFGKVNGCSKGKGGSMHYFAAEKRFWGGHGIVGGQVPLGVGLAYAAKYRGLDEVALVYMGDGAAHQGAVHEAMNLAGLYELPVIFVIENNGYAMGTHYRRHSAIDRLYTRAAAYNMHGEECDGQDVDAVYETFSRAVDRARRFQPSLIEANTYRYRGHSMADPESYRAQIVLFKDRRLLFAKQANISGGKVYVVTDHNKEEVYDEREITAVESEKEFWKKRDPLSIYGERLKDAGLLDDAMITAMEQEIDAEIDAAYEASEKAPGTPVEELFTDIYA